jgi:hypothetical protein
MIEGHLEMGGGYALKPDELDAGFVLACQSHPRAEKVSPRHIANRKGREQKEPV